jgi:hypothetical protein
MVEYPLALKPGSNLPVAAEDRPLLNVEMGQFREKRRKVSEPMSSFSLIRRAGWTQTSRKQDPGIKQREDVVHVARKKRRLGGRSTALLGDLISAYDHP